MSAGASSEIGTNPKGNALTSPQNEAAGIVIGPVEVQTDISRRKQVYDGWQDLEPQASSRSLDC